MSDTKAQDFTPPEGVATEQAAEMPLGGEAALAGAEMPLDPPGPTGGAKTALLARPAWTRYLRAGSLGLAGLGGAGFLGLGAAFCAARTRTRAVRLFLASVIYLPVLFGALALGRASIL